MATINSEESTQKNRIAVYVLLGVFTCAVLFVVIAYFNRPPQMGPDEEVFKTVDALYTAVRNRDEKRVTECEARLKAYRETGKLPADAAETLDGIIAKARAGNWETAAERLYEFMLAQKREGAMSEPPKHAPPKKKGAK